MSARTPGKNMGSAPTLRSRADPTMRAYLRFSIPDPGGSITGAALRLRAAGDTTRTIVRGSGVGWSESAVTYRNAPQPREILGELGGASAQDWGGVDVGEWVPRSGDAQVSFVVTSRQDRTASFHSREAGSSAPLLILTIQPDGPDPQPGFPTRAAFYYGWFPETWGSGSQLYSNFHPSLGRYESADPSTARAHIQAMRGADIDAGIASWWGPGTNTDDRFPVLLDQSAGTPFRWSVYYEREGSEDPSAGQISSDLDYLRSNYAGDPSALRVNGDFVVFVYADPGDGCGMAGRWANADTRGIFVVLKLFSGYKDCSPKPDDWHQYAPANAVADHRPYSYSVSPGFWKSGESPRLARNLNRWSDDVDAMVASGARWQLVTTFNEWGEGTAVESADEWSSSSGRGHYLDVLAGADPPPPSPSPSPPTPSGSAPVIAAAGDIACDPSSGSFNGGLGTSSSCHMKATSDLLVAGDFDAVLPLGDIQYEDGALAKFNASYANSWGRVLGVTRPAPGNHEYITSGASGYYSYFGSRAGDPAKGYYSYDLGGWHLIALNSNCSAVGGCGAGSPQEQWLRADLAAHPTTCALAYWHHPRYSSGEHGENTSMTAVWKALQDHGAEVVLSGHDHDYERFAPMDAFGNASSGSGIRQFVVGTGGKNHYSIGTPEPNSQVRNDDTFGVLSMTLKATSYSWSFLPEPGKSFTDSGSANCH